MLIRVALLSVCLVSSALAAQQVRSEKPFHSESPSGSKVGAFLVGSSSNLSVSSELRNQKVNQSVSGGIAPGIGVSWETPLSSYSSSQPGFSFEADLIFQGRRFGNAETNRVDISSNWLKLNPMVKFYPAPIFSMSAGIFYSRAVSNLSDSVSGRTISFDEASFRKNDFGFSFGLALTPEIAQNIALLIEGRYQLGLVDLETQQANISAQTREISFLTGIKFDL